MAGFVAAVLVAVGLTGCTLGPRGIPGQPGLPNFAQVDPHLYRGAQPTTEGLQALCRSGIKTIINLRMPTDAVPEEEPTARACGILYTNIPMTGMGAPTDDQINQVLSTISTAVGPVFIHCKYGCDRTGTAIACYRIQHDHWENQKALDEAEFYGMSYWEFGMKSYVRAWHSPQAK